MTKYIFLLINFVGVFSYYLITGGEVVITPNIPEEVNAGDEFTVEVKISKGDLNQFARFMHKLPPGFTPSELDSHGAKFEYSTSDNNVKFVWFSGLPPEEEFTVSYKVKVDTNIYGNFYITGKFAYVDEDFDRREVAYSEWTTILVLNDAYKDKILELRQQEKMAESDPNSVKCSRKREISGNEMIVSLNINKNNSKYSKIYEIVPPGFRAESIDLQEGFFSKAGCTVKFMWQKAPEGDFNVSYKLIPESGILKEVPEIKGTYYYMNANRQTLSTPVVETTSQSDLITLIGSDGKVEIDTNKVDTVKTNTEKLIAEELLAEQKKVEEQKKAEELLAEQKLAEELKKATEEKKAEELLAEQKKIEEQKKAEELLAEKNKTEEQKKAAEQKKAEELKAASAAHVEYKVQICALKILNRNPNYFNTNPRFGIKDQVSIERHEGWRKYIVGAFEQYPTAQNYRDNLLQTTNAPQAFITAYNGKERVTVQEALMIQNK